MFSTTWVSTLIWCCLDAEPAEPCALAASRSGAGTETAAAAPAGTAALAGTTTNSPSAHASIGRLMRLAFPITGFFLLTPAGNGAPGPSAQPSAWANLDQSLAWPERGQPYMRWRASRDHLTAAAGPGARPGRTALAAGPGGQIGVGQQPAAY